MVAGLKPGRLEGSQLYSLISQKCHLYTNKLEHKIQIERNIMPPGRANVVNVFEISLLLAIQRPASAS